VLSQKFLNKKAYPQIAAFSEFDLSIGRSVQQAKQIMGSRKIVCILLLPLCITNKTTSLSDRFGKLLSFSKNRLVNLGWTHSKEV